MQYLQWIELLGHLSTYLRFESHEDEWHYYQNEHRVLSLKPSLLARLEQAYKHKPNYEPPNYLVLIMEAGEAALAYYEQHQLLNHKVIRRYMVRKKQGKAQYNYLKTKGKSRAGSRVRLAETQGFVADIAQKIQEWEIIDQAQYIFYSASQPLWHLLFQNDSQYFPFQKDDPRLQKIPLHLPEKNYQTLRQLPKLIADIQLLYHDETIINIDL